MLESSNSTNTGNVSQASGGLQPFAQIQQFNQDTGNGPICCKIAGSSPGLVSASTTGTDVPIADTTDTATTNDDEDIEEDNNDDNSNRNDEDNNDDNSNRNDDNNNDDNNNDDNNNDDNNNDNDDGGSIMDSVEDTIRDSGIDFSFD
ncbi:MAG: hypothetical protein P0116_04350 [Candidatus Nitrosocosmicus sp.]|nr:hypothetical protein [Candidatus Nitrosocosmicus sp.]